MSSDTILKASEILDLEVPDPFVSGLLCILVAERRHLDPGELHSFPERPGCWYLFALSEGSLQMTHEGSRANLRNGNAVIFSGNSVSSVWPSEGGSLYVFCFQGNAADEIIRETRQDGGIFFRDGASIAGKVFAELRSCTSGGNKVPMTRASGAAYGMLMQLYGSSRHSLAEDNRLPKTVEDALRIMQKEFAFLEGMGDLSDRLGVSQEYLTRSFRRSMGVPPGKYLTQLKIEYAKLLFRQGGHTVSLVADACGFSNGNYFGKVFRESTGIAPTEYMRQYRYTGMEDPMLDPFYIL